MDEPGPFFARHKLDVDSYYRMAEVGILPPQARVELIDGEIIDMPSMGPDHASVTSALMEALAFACRGKAHLRCQVPVHIDEYNEPEPDFAVCRMREDRYGARHPGPGDIFLLIEVADSSLRFDRTVKMPLYARAGVPEVWIVDVRQRSMEVYRGPSGGAYSSAENAGPGGQVGLVMLPDVVLDLASVFY